MATVLDQHYLKRIGKPVITSVVAGAGNILTITGTNLKLQNSKYKLTVTLSGAGAVIFTTASAELTTNNLTSLVLDLTAYTGEDVSLVAESLLNVFSVSSVVNPVETIAP